MSGRPNRRNLSNIFAMPGSQLRLAAAFMVLLLIHCGIFLVQYMDAHGALGLEQDGVQAAYTGVDFAHRMLSNFWFIGVIGLMIYGVASVFLLLLTSHRIFGPVVAIRRHIRAIANGDYDSITRLRPNDELTEIAEELNSLSLILKANRAESHEKKT